MNFASTQKLIDTQKPSGLKEAILVKKRGA